jgi:DNA helicase-2/ATP-dependent DNA helicase PcrA
MKFVADLHVHSRYSRATAKNLNLENIYIAAQLKGLGVIATGDFTHPGWFSELRDKLIPAGEGLFRLRPEIAAACDRKVFPKCRRDVRFILGTEISNVYKKNGLTRKNHNLVFVPNFETAELVNRRLGAIGNTGSDGRPILGIDARDLLEIVLETSDWAFLIPAHIWTPWFSLLGSKSGFDSVGACFGDLTPEIFAVETGLSSDPAMNWRVSGLDGFTLVSNSDAHSPSKLGREANLFDTELSYSSIYRALKTRDPNQFLGTIEFFPERGKYHFDGHRKCGICFSPQKSVHHRGICPVCGKPLTLGVLYRVEELADRHAGYCPEPSQSFFHLMSLREILAELFSVGPAAKRVQQAREKLLQKCGCELDILLHHPIEKLQSADIPLLAEAVARVRKKEIHISPGFDGEYGRLKIFPI